MIKPKDREKTNFQGVVKTKLGALCDILGYLKLTEMIKEVTIYVFWWKQTNSAMKLSRILKVGLLLMWDMRNTHSVWRSPHASYDVIMLQDLLYLCSQTLRVNINP